MCMVIMFCSLTVGIYASLDANFNATGGIEFTGATPIDMPAKGTLIKMELETTATDGGLLTNTYRVLSTNGFTAEVVAMFDVNAKAQKYWDTNQTITANGTTVTKYEGSTLDTALNQTWYNTLTTAAQSAIKASSIKQYGYSRNTSETNTPYVNYSSKVEVATLTNRYIYALDVEDVVNYLGTTFTTAQISTLFWNRTTAGSTYPLFRSGSRNDSTCAWLVDSDGTLNCYGVASNWTARPAFRIDLAKIDWAEYSITMPEKGDVITIDLGSSETMSGIENAYRVLNVSGNVAEVVAMFDLNAGSIDATSTGNYEDSDLDKYLSKTWFDSLSTNAKNAIESTDVNLYSYTSNDSSFSTSHASYGDYSTKSLIDTISRKVYALDIEDVEKYFDGNGSTAGTFKSADVFKLLWYKNTVPSYITHPLLRSQCSDTDYVWRVNASLGVLDATHIYDVENNSAHPVFRIDLSKIDWKVFMPIKGDLISMNLEQTATEAGDLTNTYRVLKIEGNIAEVVAMFNIGNSYLSYWGDNSVTVNDEKGVGVMSYMNSDLDKILNETWYNALTNNAQNAIVENEIVQYSYKFGDSAYNGTSHASDADYSSKAIVYQVEYSDPNKTITKLNRKVYALDIEDIEIYFDQTFSTVDMSTLFYNATSKPEGTLLSWLRSVNSRDDSYTNYAWSVSSSIGNQHNKAGYSAARPAFKIDLSKINYKVK